MLAIILTVALLSSLFTTFALADNEADVPETAVAGEEAVSAADEGAPTLIAPAPDGEEETVPETEEKAETLATPRRSPPSARPRVMYSLSAKAKMQLNTTFRTANRQPLMLTATRTISPQTPRLTAISRPL